MVMLISGIIAIALFAAIMVAGSSSFSTDAIVRRNATHVAQSSIANIGNAFQAYRLANGGARPTAANWKSELADYAPSRSIDQMARNVAGMEWSYGVGTSRSWFCLSSQSTDKAVVQGLATAAKDAGFGKVALAESCPDSGSARATGEESCHAPSDICSGSPINGSTARALVLYPQG